MGKSAPPVQPLEPERKRTRRDLLYNSQPTPLPTKNTYAPLAVPDDESMDTVSLKTTTKDVSHAETQPKPAIAKQSRVPPLTITEKSRSQIIEWCDTIDLKNYRLKMTSIGINLFCATLEDFKKVKIILNEDKTPYFTHALREEKELRVLLKGLFVMSEEDLREALTAVDIDPKHIRQLNPRKRKFADQAHFVLSFPLGSQKMSNLKQIRYVAHCSVEWDFYAPRKFGPTQCYNCFMFGHGIRTCKLPMKCPACSGSHAIDNCSNLEESGPLRQGCKYKCPNCHGEHLATSDECPKLTEYLRIQEQLAVKNNKRPLPRPRQYAPSREDYPKLDPRQSGSIPQPTSQGSAWANNSTTRPANNLPLMSNAEIIRLSQELISSLRGCKSREDQFNVIVNMATKFLDN